MFYLNACTLWIGVMGGSHGEFDVTQHDWVVVNMWVWVGGNWCFSFCLGSLEILSVYPVYAYDCIGPYLKNIGSNTALIAE